MMDNYQGNNIVFIVGSPRSGTTWLQRILACHTKVSTGQESDLFDIYIGPQLQAWRKFLDPNSSRRGVGLGCYFLEEEFLRILKEYMLKLLEPMVGNLQPGELFIEKTPSHALFIPEIIELLPESRVIHVLRDARDVVASILSASRSWGASWAPRHARAATQMWVSHVRAVRKTAAGLPKEQIYELRYEDLYTSTQEVLKDVYQFLCLEWDEEEIQDVVEKNSPEIAKKGGGTPIPIRGEISRLMGPFVKEPQGFVRKAFPGVWKEDLSWAEKILVWRIARKIMKEVGYRWDFPWQET